MVSGWVVSVEQSPVWSVDEWLGSWTCDQPVAGSNPGRQVQPWASCLHTCASVTKQYNLVPANGRWCSQAGEVTVGLVESNDSLPPGLWLRSPAGWLPRTGISSRTLDTRFEYETTLIFKQNPKVGSYGLPQVSTYHLIDWRCAGVSRTWYGKLSWRAKVRGRRCWVTLEWCSDTAYRRPTGIWIPPSLTSLSSAYQHTGTGTRTHIRRLIYLISYLWKLNCYQFLVILCSVVKNAELLQKLYIFSVFGMWCYIGRKIFET